MRGGRLRWLSTLRGQIVAIYTLLFAVAFVLINVSVTRLVGEFLVSQRTQAQMKTIVAMSTQFAGALAQNDAAQMYTQSVRNAKELSGRVLVLDNDGIVVADSHSQLNGRALRHPEVEQVRTHELDATYGLHQVASAALPSQRTTAGTREWAVYYTACIEYQSRNIGVLLVSVPIEDVMNVVAAAVWRFAMIALGIMAMLVVCGVIVSHWIALPLAQMTNAIQQMRQGNFHARVQTKGRGEIGEMARTFNAMSEQLENVERQRQEFVSNASHELKTPLSAIKILTQSLLYQQDVPEVTYKEFLADIDEQIDRMDMLLSDLLTLAQAERSGTMHYTDEWLEQLVAQCAKTLAPLAEVKEIELVLPKNRVMVQCDRTKLMTALMNLMSNAIKYTPDGGQVSVTLSADDHDATIAVTDTGIGIPEHEQARIFERFFRVDKARSRYTGGTGLGLAIVQQVVRLHGGEVTLKSGERMGSTFTIKLPLKGVSA